MMNSDPIYKLAVGFANRHHHVLSTDVDGAHDDFVNAFGVNTPAIDKLAKSDAVRIAVLSFTDNFNGDNLTLDAKLKFDVDACPLYNEFLDTISQTLAANTRSNSAEVRRALEAVVDEDWEWFIQMAFDAIACEVVYATLKQQYMIPDA